MGQKHEDLHHMLKNLALSVGATISYSSEVMEIIPPSNSSKERRVRIGFPEGELLADVVIGADGWDSFVRNSVCKKGGGEAKTEDSGVSVFT
jgi:salicylate hydroxylase